MLKEGRKKTTPNQKKQKPDVAPPSICAVHPNPVRKQLPSDNWAFTNI